MDDSRMAKYIFNHVYKNKVSNHYVQGIKTGMENLGIAEQKHTKTESC